MRIIRKSLIRKLFFTLLLFSAFVGGIGYYLYASETDVVPFKFFIGALGVLLFFFIIFNWYDFIRPLKAVLKQMQALISGKPYKMIYSTRIDEIGVIAHFFNQVTKGLGKVSFDLKDRERMLDELTIAAQLQRDIMPETTPPVPGLQVVAKSKPATEVGGDTFNVITKGDKTYAYLGDVTGHGVAAGLIMTMVSSLVGVFAEEDENAFEIVVDVNKHIKKHIKKAMFMTMVLLCWNHKTQKLTYVGAGHEHILVYRIRTGECEAIMSGGVAIGMVPDNSKIVKEKEITLNEGDLVMLYTDGLTEARNKAGDLYGLEKLQNSFKEYASQYSAEGVHYHIATDVSDYMKGHIQDDDMTLIVIKKDKKMDGVTVATELSTSWKE